MSIAALPVAAPTAGEHSLDLRAQLYRAYAECQWQIRERLEEFAAIGRNAEAAFYELCYCLCTPATKAHHALAVIDILRHRHFYRAPLPVDELEALLRTPSHYVRFHRTKAHRLAKLHQVFPRVWQLRHAAMPATAKRRSLVHLVEGLGMKEASHFLRNTGLRELAILDRHIVSWMQRFGLPVQLPKSAAEYERVEALFAYLAQQLALPAEELDLLLWFLSTGEILR